MNHNNAYKVFLSFTYNDLKGVRNSVINSILKLNHHPICMEHFTAGSLPQINLIKSKMDECQFYVLIIGGLYGSVIYGKSYTQLEFEYAKQKKIPIIAVLPQIINCIPYELREKDKAKKEKLNKFIQKARSGRTVSFWNEHNEISLLVSNGLTNEINHFNDKHRWLNYRMSNEYLFQLKDILGNNFRQIIKDAKSISILGRSALSIVKDHKNDLLEEMRNGCKLNITVLNPLSGAVEFIYGANSKEFKRKFNYFAKSVVEIESKLDSKHKGNLKFQVTMIPPCSSVIIIEKRIVSKSIAIAQLDIKSIKQEYRPTVCINHCDDLYINLTEEFKNYQTHESTTNYKC